MFECYVRLFIRLKISPQKSVNKYIYLFTYDRLVFDEFGHGMVKNIMIGGDRKRNQRSSNEPKKHLNLSVAATEKSVEAAIVIRR